MPEKEDQNKKGNVWNFVLSDFC